MFGKTLSIDIYVQNMVLIDMKKSMVEIFVADNGVDLDERIERVKNRYRVILLDSGRTFFAGDCTALDSTEYDEKMALDNDFFRRMSENDFSTDENTSADDIEAWANEYDTLAPNLRPGSLYTRLVPQECARIGIALSTSDAIKVAKTHPHAAMKCFLPKSFAIENDLI